MKRRLKSLVWLMVYLVGSLLWWFGAVIFEFQGAIDNGMARTRAYLGWFVRQDWLPDRFQQFVADYLADLPREFSVTDRGYAPDDLPLYQHWVVWAISGIVLFVAFLILRWAALNLIGKASARKRRGIRRYNTPSVDTGSELDSSVPWLLLAVMGALVGLLVLPLVF